jgi:hypothetical protein
MFVGKVVTDEVTAFGYSLFKFAIGKYSRTTLRE